MSETIESTARKSTDKMGGGPEKASAKLTGRGTGPTDEDPFALDWTDYGVGVLRAFLMSFPDTEGFDFTAEELMKEDHDELVERCGKVQQECGKAIDKPWACVLRQLFVENEEKLPTELEGLDWSAEDDVALRSLAKAQTGIVKKLQAKRGKSASPKAKASERKKLPEQENEDDVPLSKLAPKPSDDGYKTPEEDAEADDEAEPKKKKKKQKKAVEVRRSPRKKAREDAAPVPTTEAALTAELKKMREEQRKLQAQLKELAAKGAGSSKGADKGADKKKKASKKSRKRKLPSSSESSSESSESSDSSDDTDSSDSSVSASEDSSSESSSKKKKKLSKKKRAKRDKAERKSKRSKKKGKRGGQKLSKEAKLRGKAGASLQYQVSVLANEVRGTKVEDSSNIHELFAAWLDLANTQSEFDDAAEAYAPSGVSKTLSDARRQLQDDLKLAGKMVPDGVGKAEVVASAEKLLVNHLVQLSRAKVLVREMDMFRMCVKAMEKVREFCGKSASRQQLGPVTRSESVRRPDQGRPEGTGDGGKGGGSGRGGGKYGGKGKGKGPTCFNCGVAGHVQWACPFPMGTANGTWKQQAANFQPGPPGVQEGPKV